MKNSVEINLEGFARIRNILGQDLFHLGGPFQRKSCYFHMSNLPFKGAVSLLEKPILPHNMRYVWHRASLSKVQYVLKCEILSTATLKRFSPLHWNLSTAIHKHIARVLWCPYPSINQKDKLQTLNVFDFILGIFFLALEVQTVVTNWNALHAEKQKHNSRRSQCCWVLLGMHFKLNTRRNSFIEFS